MRNGIPQRFPDGEVSAFLHEVVVPGEKAPATGMGFYYMPPSTGTDEEVPRKRLESSKFQEIPVRVELLVRFDLAASKADQRGVQ